MVDSTYHAIRRAETVLNVSAPLAIGAARLPAASIGANDQLTPWRALAANPTRAAVVGVVDARTLTFTTTLNAANTAGMNPVIRSLQLPTVVLQAQPGLGPSDNHTFSTSARRGLHNLTLTTTALPPYALALPHLETLNVAGSPLSIAAHGFAGMDGVNCINCDSVRGLANFYFQNVRPNPTSPGNLSSLSSSGLFALAGINALDLTGNSIDSIQQHDFDGAVYLKYLWIGNNLGLNFIHCAAFTHEQQPLLNASNIDESGNPTSTWRAGCPSPTPTTSVTPSATLSGTVTGTNTASGSKTPSATDTPSATLSGTGSQTYTPTHSGTVSGTLTGSGTPSMTQTGSGTPSWTHTSSGTPSLTQTGSATPSFTQTGSATPSFTQTGSGTPSYSPTGSGTPSFSPTSSGTPSITPTGSVTPTITPTGAITPTYTPTGSGSSTATPTGSSMPTATSTATPTGSGTHTATQTGSGTASVTLSPASTPSATPPVLIGGVSSSASYKPNKFAAALALGLVSVAFIATLVLCRNATWCLCCCRRRRDDGASATASDDLVIKPAGDDDAAAATATAAGATGDDTDEPDVVLV